MNERDVEISKREAKKRKEKGDVRSRKDKLAIEKRILRLSFMGSVFFILAEGVMAWYTHSHSLWTGLPVRLRRSGHDRTIYGAGSASV